jgi:hypothetical protein
MQNRIDATLSPEDKDKILQFIRDIEAKLPFLVDLSAAEIASLSKMGDRGQSFVYDAITQAEQDDSYLPRSFDVAAMRRDIDLTENLPPIIAAIASLKERLDDTLILAGSDAYAAALDIYDSAQRHGKGAALSESLRNMSKRFARKKKPKTPEDPDKPEDPEKE